jgi:hypothetical protein
MLRSSLIRGDSGKRFPIDRAAQQRDQRGPFVIGEIERHRQVDGARREREPASRPYDLGPGTRRSGAAHRVVQELRPPGLRRRIKPKDIKVDFSSALATALKLAKTKEAGYLPGWCGPLNEAA